MADGFILHLRKLQIIPYQALFILCHVVVHAALDPVYWVQKVAYRKIMVQCINDQCNIFAHVTGDIIWLLKKLGRLIYQVCSEKLVKYTCLVGFIKFVKAICK